MRRKPHTTRRNVLTATGALSLLGVAGVATGSSSPVATAPVPDDANDRPYPTMGTSSDAPTATVYGNFKCPYTREFVFGNLEAIIEEFVLTGQLNLEFYNLAYEPGSTSEYFISSSDPRLAAAGIGVWNEDPDSYWQFHYETFEDAPSGYVDYDELASRARSAGVSNVDELIDRAQAGGYDGEVEQVPAAAADDGVTFTPTLELAGDTAAPHHGEQAILDWIDTRLEDAPAETAEEGDSDGDEQRDDEREDAESESETEESGDDESESVSEESDTEAESEEPDAESETESESAESADESETEDAETDRDEEAEGGTDEHSETGTSEVDEGSEPESDTQGDEADEPAETSPDDAESAAQVAESDGTTSEPADADTETTADDCPYR